MKYGLLITAMSFVLVAGAGPTLAITPLPGGIPGHQQMAQAQPGAQTGAAPARGESGKAAGAEGSSAKGSASLTTEERTKITTVIRNEHIAPVTSVNFNVAVGTRVPRDVSFHPLPADVVTIYPEWRGYNFILIRDEIVVIDPATFEIVAILNA